MVKDLETDKAAGSESGVDDHAIKLPLLCESAVWTCVATCCWVLECVISEEGMS